MCFKRYKRELFDRPKASLLPLKARMVRAEVVEAFLYGCATWTPLKGHYAKLRTIHHGMLLRILGAWCKSPNKRIILYAHADSEAYSRDSFRFPRRRPFFFLTTIHHRKQSRAYRVTRNYCEPMTFPAESPPAQGQSPLGSPSHGCCLCITMDQ